MSEKIYAERDIIGMDSKGGHYCRHISAMTREDLHSKSDIAAELGFRDMLIAALEAKCAEMAAENASLKSALNPEEIPEDAVEAFTETAIMDHDWDDTGSWSWVENDTDVIRAVLAAMATPATPATDAFLAEVRAQGVEMMREHPAIKLCSLTHVCDEFAAQLRQEAAQ